MATHSRFCICYLAWSNADSQRSNANETVRCIKRAVEGTGMSWKQGVLRRQTRATGLSESVTLLISTFKPQLLTLSDVFIKIARKYLQIDFRVAKTFIGFSLNHASHILIKRISIREVRQSAVRDDVVAENLSLLKLASPVYAAWRRVLLPNWGSFSSHPLDASTTTSWKHLTKVSVLIVRPCGKMN